MASHRSRPPLRCLGTGLWRVIIVGITAGKAGIKGIKVDFMQSDKQYVMQLYRDILRDAAAHGLFVDLHGSTIPRGWAWGLCFTPKTIELTTAHY